MATHDYVIANGTGAAVRSDLNGALAAIVSNNSSATAPATTYAYQWWADTTTGLLKIRNSANSAWVTIGTLASTNLGLLSLAGGTMTGVLAVTAGTAALPGIAFDSNTGIYSPGDDQVAISTGGSPRITVDSSGRILVGTSSTSANTKFMVQGAASTNNANIYLARADATPANDDPLGYIIFSDSNHGDAAYFYCARDGGTWNTSTSRPTRLVFSTTADGAPSPTERMRITQNGSVLIGKTLGAGDVSVAGTDFGSGYGIFTRDGGTSLYLNRKVDDGNLVEFYQASTIEGTISVSGTTVSYNGAHLSRWSQLPSGAERTEILRGTVLSSIDEMCEWEDEANEQLNRMKVSDVEGDKNVSGVFQAWDDDDDTYTNDFYCAMTGDFIIRIAEGVTVERGDLMMSAGDGTAKPQDDDIIRSKTIAKVTSANVSCTYPDGSYCVPCVLMAC